MRHKKVKPKTKTNHNFLRDEVAFGRIKWDFLAIIAVFLSYYFFIAMNSSSLPLYTCIILHIPKIYIPICKLLSIFAVSTLSSYWTTWAQEDCNKSKSNVINSQWHSLDLWLEYLKIKIISIVNTNTMRNCRKIIISFANYYF